MRRNEWMSKGLSFPSRSRLPSRGISAEFARPGGLVKQSRWIWGIAPLLLWLGCGSGQDAGEPFEPACGNGIRETGEQCDRNDLAAQTCAGLGLNGGDLACNADCTLDLVGCTAQPVCGNGAVELGEACDDANDDSEDGCSNSCDIESGWVCSGEPSHCSLGCGNGQLDQGEVCDDGNTEDCDGCRSDCSGQDHICGDGVAECSEICDDGNTVSGDGCSADCLSDETCGNGYVDSAAGEICDDGSANSDEPDAACRSDCKASRCGDGIVDSGEACDDGNTVSGDGCSAGCESDETCGNGYTDVAAGENCDDGNTTDCDGCRSDCSRQDNVCSDGIIECGEECDDGATVDGDGCSSSCVAEFGWHCMGSPSSCVQTQGWIQIPAGTFQMGAPFGEVGRRHDETVRTVTLTRDFAILDREVTQRTFESVMGYNPSIFSSCGLDCPAEAVSWHEAAAFCNALSATAGLALCYTCTGSGVGVICEPSQTFATPYECPGYRLPTEAEWEYAARAGTTTATYSGNLLGNQLGCQQPNPVLDPIASFCGNSGWTPLPVGGRLPNSWSLHDMLGNVLEWCHDWYGSYSSGAATDPTGSPSGPHRVFRGGSWGHPAHSVRAAARGKNSPIGRNGGLGFRPVRSVAP